MNKSIISVLLLASMILVLFTQLGMVSAKPPMAVEGDFDYTFEITGERWPDGHYCIDATEWETWTGDFVGESVAVFRVVMFRSGFWNVWLRSSFSGSVLGREGTCVIQLVGKKPEGEDWYGQWVILSGDGELADLRGRGNWWGPGFGATGPDIYYEGEVHFKPD